MRGNRVAQGVVIGLVVGGLVVLSAIAVVFILLGTCDGDGGSPYSAHDSTAGRFCDGSVGAVWAVAALAGPALTALVLGIAAIRLRAWKRVARAVGAGVGVLVVLSGVVLALPKNCSGSDQRAYDAWLSAGRPGNPPADCDRY